MDLTICFLFRMLAFIVLAGPLFLKLTQGSGVDESVFNYKKHQGRVPLHGNELEQYERYMNLTKDMSNEKTWKLWTDCVNELSRNGGSNDACTDQCKEKMREEMKLNPLHDDRIRKRSLKPDCTYDIIIGDHRIEGGSNNTQTLYTLHVPNGAPFVTFNIATGVCKSDDILDGAEYSGGASFEITLASHYDLVSCVTEDRFHGIYLVVCPIHPLEKAHERGTRGASGIGGVSGERRGLEASQASSSHLFNLRVTLDFEHFDAFSDVFAPTQMLDTTIFQGTLQMLKNIRGGGISASLLNRDRSASKTRLMGSLVREVANQERDHTIYGHWTLDRETLSHGAFSDFHWQGTGDAFIGSRKTFQDMFGASPAGKYVQATTHLVGESHMRYYWDFYYYLYYGAKALGQFDRKHGYSNHMPHLVLESVLFATDMGDYFAGRECPPAGSKAIYAFQFGTWDLTFAALRNLLSNPAHAMHLVDGVTGFAEKCAKKGSSAGHVHLLWVTSSPYPKCSKPECKHRRRFNNHYAVGALTQSLTSKLEKAVAAAHKGAAGAEAGQGSSPAFTFEVLDTRWIASTKMERREYPCQNHLLCHPDGEVMQLSRPGLAVAGELLGSVMRHVTGKSTEELSRSHGHEDQVLYTQGDTQGGGDKQYYVFNAGILRKIPDMETLACLNRSASGSLPARGPISSAELRDYPLIEIPLPSRKEATVLAGQFTPSQGSSLWVMGPDCCRTLAPPGTDTPPQEGRVMEMDLEDIPHTCNSKP